MYLSYSDGSLADDCILCVGTFAYMVSFDIHIVFF